MALLSPALWSSLEKKPNPEKAAVGLFCLGLWAGGAVPPPCQAVALLVEEAELLAVGLGWLGAAAGAWPTMTAERSWGLARLGLAL